MNGDPGTEWNIRKVAHETTDLSEEEFNELVDAR